MSEPFVYKPGYMRIFDKAKCAASVWHAIGIGGTHNQCDRAGKHKIDGHLWCTQHAKEFPPEKQPEALRPKRVEGAKWWPGQTVYRVDLEHGHFDLHSGKVKSVRKNDVEMKERARVSEYKSIVPHGFVFPSVAEAYAAAAVRLKGTVQSLEKQLAERKRHLEVAEEKAKG